jgi:hypothetical protein
LTEPERQHGGDELLHIMNEEASAVWLPRNNMSLPVGFDAVQHIVESHWEVVVSIEAGFLGWIGLVGAIMVAVGHFVFGSVHHVKVLSSAGCRCSSSLERCWDD